MASSSAAGTSKVEGLVGKLEKPRWFMARKIDFSLCRLVVRAVRAVQVEV